MFGYANVFSARSPLAVGVHRSLWLWGREGFIGAIAVLYGETFIALLTKSSPSDDLIKPSEAC